MSRVVHFEIHADDPQRAMAFYSALFAWKFIKFGEMDYWLVITGDESSPGINGGMLLRHGAREGKAFLAFVCTVDVKNIDACLKEVEKAGGQVTLAKHAIPKIGWFAYARDTEGNVFGLLQSDKSAK
jgi:predicted enzyme related to lactoylglutathione lyase